MWRAIDGASRRPLGGELGPGGDCSAKKLIAKIDSGNCSFVTDEWGGFFRLLSEDREFYGKDLTFPIEATNTDIRHRLPRFLRKTKASSRSIPMVHASLKLTHYLQHDTILQSYVKPFVDLFA